MQTLSNEVSFLDSNLQYKILQLASWPPLSELLLDTAPQMTRICALLARKPSAGMLIPVMLDMTPQTTYPLLGTLYAKGHICVAGGAATVEQNAPPNVELVKNPEPPAATSSFLSKVWQRLTDRK
ncbi:hypothetical protein BH10PSE16_BH10PSE16_42500 [soil metagenome]